MASPQSMINMESPEYSAAPISLGQADRPQKQNHTKDKGDRKAIPKIVICPPPNDTISSRLIARHSSSAMLMKQSPMTMATAGDSTSSNFSDISLGPYVLPSTNKTVNYSREFGHEIVHGLKDKVMLIRVLFVMTVLFAALLFTLIWIQLKQVGL